LSKQPFYFIANIGNGSLWMGPRQGVTHVVSLIENAEVERYRLESEGNVLENLDIGFTRFPVDDFNTPDAVKFQQLIADLTARLKQNETLFLHCAGGVGRAGTTASCLLVNHGMDPDDTMTLVSSQRGEKSPETLEQEEFVRGFQL